MLVHISGVDVLVHISGVGDLVIASDAWRGLHYFRSVLGSLQTPAVHGRSIDLPANCQFHQRPSALDRLHSVFSSSSRLSQLVIIVSPSPFRSQKTGSVSSVMKLHRRLWQILGHRFSKGRCFPLTPIELSGKR